MDVLDPAFPVMVKSARALVGWSQARLAKQAGVSTIFVSRLERFESVGRLRTLKKIADALEQAGVKIEIEPTQFGITIDGERAQRTRSRVRELQMVRARES
ncbi:MAG: helix-turn-helix domain-containing protein [Actinobacteria bacterium]|nr:helix-turn-helix domain-containing protein [Actinomycetota bacterium]